MKPALPDGTPSTRAAIINELAVSHLGFASATDAIGKTVYSGQPDGSMRVVNIVGVIANIHLRSARDSIDPMMFLVEDTVQSVLNIDLDPTMAATTVHDIEAVWNRVVPDFPLNQSFVDDNFNKFYQADEKRAQIFGGFSLFAILVSCLGLYGLAAFTAERRTREVGIRKVMGAGVFDIVRLLTFEFSKPVLLANLIAWPIAWYFANEWLQGFAFRITLGIQYFLAAGGLALLIALLTVAGHATHTAKANPIKALRHE